MMMMIHNSKNNDTVRSGAAQGLELVNQRKQFEGYFSLKDHSVFVEALGAFQMKVLSTVRKQRGNFQATVFLHMSTSVFNVLFVELEQRLSCGGRCITSADFVSVFERTKFLIPATFPDHKIVRKLKYIKDELFQFDSIRTDWLDTVNAWDLLFCNMVS